MNKISQKTLLDYPRWFSKPDNNDINNSEKALSLMTPIKILVIENKMVFIKQIRQRLLSLGYTPPLFVSSSQAIQATAEFQPDLILMRAGSEAKIEVELEVVRQIQKSLDIPVIYLLDQLDQEIVRQAEMTQPYHYLLRPFETRVLHLTIETALHQHKLEKKLKESEEKLTTVQAERQQSEAIERDQRLLAETLGRVGLALNAILDLPDLLDLICQESMNLFKVKAAYIWLVQGDELVGFAAHGVAREKFIGLRLPLFDPITLGPRVIREKRPIFVNEASQSSQINQKLRQRLQIKAILGVPLIKGDKAVGALMISDTDNAQRFGPDDIKTATALGSYAAIAIENARLLEAEREQRELAEALREVGTVLSATLDFNTILDYLLDQVARVVPYDTGNVFLIEHGYAHVVRTRGHEQFSAGLASAAATLSFNLATTPNMQQMVEIKQPLIIPDTATDPRWLKGEIWAHVRSWAGAPIVAHGQVSALFSLDKVETGFYQAKHAERLAIFAGQVGLALENARLFEAEARRRREAETLGEAAAALTSALDLEQVLDSTLTHLKRVIPYDSASVFLIKGDHLYGVAGRDIPRPEEIIGRNFPAAIDDPFLEELRQTQRPLCLADVRTDPRFAYWGGTDYIRSWLAVPLIVRGQFIGYITLDSRQVAAYNQPEVDLAQVFANQAAVAIENARLYTQTRRRLEEQNALRSAGAIISSTLELEVVLNRVAEQMGQIVAATSAYIYSLEPQTMVSTMLAEYFSPAAHAQEVVSELGCTYDLPRQFPEISAALQTGQFALCHLNDPVLTEPMRAYMQQYSVQTLMIIPLQVGGQMIAFAELWDSRQQDFTHEEIALCQDFAQRAAVAIQNARLFEKTRRQAQQLAILNELAGQMTGALEVRDLCTIVAECVYAAFDYLNVAIFTADLPTRQVILQSVVGAYANIFKSGEYRQTFDSGIIGRVATMGKTLVVNNAPEHPDFVELGGAPIRSELAIPLKIGKQIIGVLNVDSDRLNAFDESDVAALTTVADQLALGLEKARLFAETCQWAEQLEALRQISQDLIALRDLDTLLHQITERAVQLLDGGGGGIFLYRPEQQALEWVAAVGPRPAMLGTSVSQGEGLSGRVWATGEPMIVNDYQGWPGKLPHWSGPSTGALVGVPIQWGGEFLGVLNIEALNAKRQFTPGDATLLAQFATQAAIAIQNVRLYEQAQRHAAELEMRVAERTFELQVLYELTQALGQATQLGDVVRLILLHLYQAIPYDVAASLLMTNSTGALVIQSQRPVSPQVESHIQEIMSVVLKQPLMSEALEVRRIQSKMETATRLPLEDLASIMQVPILVDGTAVGLILVATERPDQFDHEQLHLLQTVADQAAESIRRLQALLAAEHQRLENLVAHLPDGVVLLDAERHIVLANQVAQKFLAVLTRASIGDKLTDLGGRPIELILNPDSTGLPQEVEVQDYSHQAFEIIAKPMAVGPEAGGWTLAIRDVTADRAAQERAQQQDRLVAVGQLAAGIAHDFNNILTSIIGFAELARIHPGIPPAIDEDLQRIIHQGQRAAHLVRQILDFSRQSITEKRPIDLVPFLKETIKLLERTIPEDIRITLDIEPNHYEAYTLHADPTQITQVLTNLAVNARDAMPAGGILQFQLYIFSLDSGKRPPYPEMSPGHWLALSISDTGVGIGSEILPHIFEPFFTTKEVGKGTGLGLAQVYGIVTQHEGYIDVKTQVGQGTTFTLYLPAILPSSKILASATEPEALQGHGEVILLVEDDADVLEVTQAMLEHLGYGVVTATNGRHALEVYDQYQAEIALVLTDVTMPEMGGVALSQTLQAKYPAIKVIALTGYPLETESKDLLTQGIVDWLQKPLNRHQLGQTISRSLKLEAKNRLRSEG